MKSIVVRVSLDFCKIIIVTYGISLSSKINNRISNSCKAAVKSYNFYFEKVM